VPVSTYLLDVDGNAGFFLDLTSNRYFCALIFLYEATREVDMVREVRMCFATKECQDFAVWVIDKSFPDPLHIIQQPRVQQT
jgi:hypothetical protein